MKVAALFICLLLTVPASASDRIPPQAQELLPLLASVIQTQWASCPAPWIIAGKIEQESGWRVKAELKTNREYGFGLGQITIAYNADGTERFNNFTQALRVTMMAGIITWAERFDPRFQLTYSVLSDRSNFAAVSTFFDDDESRLAGMLVAYNAGLGGIVRRKAEAVRRGMTPPRRWFGGLEMIHARCEERLLYGKPLYQRINEYPVLILRVRSPKYKAPMLDLLREARQTQNCAGGLVCPGPF